MMLIILLEIGKEILKFTKQDMLNLESLITTRCLRLTTQRRSILSTLYRDGIDMFNMNYRNYETLKAKIIYILYNIYELRVISDDPLSFEKVS